MPLPSFYAYFGLQALGPLVHRTLVNKFFSSTDEASGYKGSIYTFIYANLYTNRIILQEKIVLINQDGKGFKLSGYERLPAK